jgi:glycosyltransferase involved in cell wall biosynthesis
MSDSSSRQRLCALPVDDERGASTRFRVLAHLPALEAAGFRVDLRLPLRGSGPASRLWRIADLSRDVIAAGGAEVVYIHRKMYPPAFASALRRAARGRIVLDIDDAVDLPPPRRTADEAARRRYRSNFEATTEVADLVICGNRELERRVPHGRTVRIPTPIDTDRFRPERLGSERPLTVGWVGHSDNLPYLQAIAAPLRELCRRFVELRLIVIADRPVEIEGVPVEFRPWSLEREVSCFEGIAVGLMPLEDTPWARAKCSFKAIQYMSLGIPAVVSPVGMNVEVVEDGVSGYLPADERGWVEAVDALLRDGALAQRIGAAGRVVVESRYSLQRVSPRLVSALRAG